MWFVAFSFEMWHNMRSGRAIRGKWRIPDGKGENNLFFHIRSSEWSHKLRASMVTELDDTLPCLLDVHGIVCGPPTDARRGIRWKTCTRVCWTRLDSSIVIVNYCHSWCLHDSRVSFCEVISLAMYKLIRIAAHSRILVIVACC
jgi:hypothetical protein